MPKGQSNSSRASSLPDLEIEAGFNLNRSTENMNKEIDRENTSIEAIHENCDTTIEVREGGLRGWIMGRSETTEIDCEPENEAASESFLPEANGQPETSEESRESENISFLESQSESFLESEPNSEVESEFESTFC